MFTKMLAVVMFYLYLFVGLSLAAPILTFEVRQFGPKPALKSRFLSAGSNIAERSPFGINPSSLKDLHFGGAATGWKGAPLPQAVHV